MGLTEKRLTSFEDLVALRAHTAAEPLGIELVQIDENQIVLTMPITDAARQPMGWLHGGVSMVLAETAASLHACYGQDLSKIVPVGIDINGTHIGSARDGHVKAVGTVIRRSRTFIFHQIDIFHVETGELLSTARLTSYYRRIQKPPAQVSEVAKPDAS